MFVPDSMHRRYTTPRRYPNLCRVRINNESLCPSSLSLPSTYTLRTRQFLSFFTSVTHTCNTRWNAFLLRFLARFRYKWDEKNGRGEGGLFVGIIGRFEGGKEVGSRFEGTYSWEEIDGGREEIR